MERVLLILPRFSCASFPVDDNTNVLVEKLVYLCDLFCRVYCVIYIIPRVTFDLYTCHLLQGCVQDYTLFHFYWSTCLL